MEKYFYGKAVNQKVVDSIGNVWPPEARRRNAVQCSKCYTVNVLFSIHAILILCSHYTHLMSSSWTTASNFTRNINSNCVKLHVCNYTHFGVFVCMVRVRCVDTVAAVWTLRGHCMDTACNVRVVCALHACNAAIPLTGTVFAINRFCKWYNTVSLSLSDRIFVVRQQRFRAVFE